MPCCHDQRNSTPTIQLHSRRAIITTLACTAVLPAGHLVAATNASPDDERFMRIALDEARQADFPFGAVIVRDGQILVRGRNLGRTNGDPTAHGEMIAIRRCLAEHGSAESYVNAGQLVRVLPEWEIQPVPLSAVFPGRRLMPARTRAFIDALVDKFGGSKRA